MLRNLSIAILAMVIGSMAQSPVVVDVDGQPLTGGVEYYVLPAATDIAGGLTLVNPNGSCPLYVGQAPLSTTVSQGIPVIFTPASGGESVIREGTDLSVVFSGASICVQSTRWRIGEEDEESSRRLIVTGEGGQNLFRIDNNGGLYNLGWCPSCNQPNCGRPRCGAAGILIRNATRFLALDAAAFPFRFRRA
ncbi:kunitz type trypsin inhibitor 104-like [Euphorbia lathyris]|uniref:kunitz type trypsin inhibitor 104-like n=1 Tax=Euphorbia lathyris TaxID=212925 RepID=UPI0033141C2A